ncbi:kinase-like protein [Thelephora ganbajun]|uniref:Kinase-like protein n=1 Tax=Thelephora ganbajun TaxID=370292 RepID=A0ACB6ZAQ3_THEGA|nr:kinase-like protein [Thelephora ganbajun]
MASSSSPTLQKLHSLDKSSSDFGNLLCNVLYGEEYVQFVSNFEGDDLAWLVDYLDRALDGLDPSSPASRKCLRELKNICGTNGILPTSYTLSADPLNIDPRPIASGGYGDVYHGTLNGSGVCIKRARVYTLDTSEKAFKTFCSEAVMWKRLNHPNVLPFLGVTIAPLQLISEWMPGGTLPDYIKNNSDADRLALLSEVAEGLCYLHSCNVIHGDLKGLNILVDDSGHTRIADFGLAMVTQNPDSMPSAPPHRGYTPRWAAPEVMTEEAYSKEADIFSFAMVMIEVFTSAVPFGNVSHYKAMSAVVEGERPPRPKHPAVTGGLWELMRRCWNQDPFSRPEVSEILQALSTLDPPAWKRLIGYSLSTDGRISLITSLFSNRDEVEIVGYLSGGDAQAFVNVVDEVSDSLAPEIHRECLHHLASICGSQALLPKSLQIPLCYDPSETPRYLDGLSDVRKGRYHDQEVVARALKVSPHTNLERIRKRFCRQIMIWRALCHPNVLLLLGVTMTETQLVMVSEWTANGNINEFMKAHPDANQLELLGDVTRGLIYVHGQGVIHGDLKGANIMIDKSGRACLSDFSLVNIISDQLAINPIPSALSHYCHTPPWTAPEVLDKGAYSKAADIFSFAMVMIEVFTGAVPFGDRPPFMATSAIAQGIRPPQPKHPAVTGGLWKLIQRCWDHDPHLRPEAVEVLRVLLTFAPPAWERLIGYPLSTDERVSLITSLFSDIDEVEVVGSLSGDDAQAFVDVIDETLDSLPQEIYGRCLRYLYKICSNQSLLPKSLQIPLCYDPSEISHYSGGFSDVWKGRYHDQEVAVTALNVFLTTDLERIRKRFCGQIMIWRTLHHPNVLPLLGVTMTKTQLVVVSEWKENGNINGFIKAHPDVNRLELLRDITKGLIYMHDRGIIHGDLKGANVMIDSNGRACLADFDLVTLIPGQSGLTSSHIAGGTYRWMSPELIDPERFGLKESRSTRESDCYALGMVIYETLSGQVPFSAYSNTYVVLYKVMRGDCPERPQGEEGKLFTDSIWKVVKLCWKHKPGDRASAKDVLRYLEGIRSLPRLPANTASDSASVASDSTGMASDSGPAIAHGNDEPQVPPRNLRGRLVGWLARFKIASGGVDTMTKNAGGSGGVSPMERSARREKKR